MAKTMRNGLLYGILLLVGVTFGMQMAESGTRTTYGPELDNRVSTTTPTNQRENLVPRAEITVPDTARQQSVPLKQNDSIQTPADLLIPPPSQPSVDRFADKTAHLLQQLSQKGIHWVASLIDSTSE